MKPLWTLMALGLLAPAAPGARAEQGGGKIELTPHLGFLGASPVFGIAVGMAYPSLEFRLSAGQATGEIGNFYPVSLELLLPLGRVGKSIPMGIAGGGLALSVPVNTVAVESVSSGQIHFGAGVKHYISEFIGIDIEVTQLVTQSGNSASGGKSLVFFQSVSLGLVLVIGRGE